MKIAEKQSAKAIKKANFNAKRKKAIEKGVTKNTLLTYALIINELDRLPVEKLIDCLRSIFFAASFISLRNYFAKTTKEIANHIVNYNISFAKSKLADCFTLHTTNLNAFPELQEKHGNELLTNALAKLTDEFTTVCKRYVNSLNFSELREAVNTYGIDFIRNVYDYEITQTKTINRSNAQKNAYVYIAEGVAYCIETKELHLRNVFAVSKQVIRAGEKKQAKSQPITIAKNDIKYALKLKTNNYRTFVISGLDSMKIKGETIEFTSVHDQEFDIT